MKWVVGRLLDFARSQSTGNGRICIGRHNLYAATQFDVGIRRRRLGLLSDISQIIMKAKERMTVSRLVMTHKAVDGNNSLDRKHRLWIHRKRRFTAAYQRKLHTSGIVLGGHSCKTIMVLVEVDRTSGAHKGVLFLSGHFAVMSGEAPTSSKGNLVTKRIARQ